MVAFIGFIAFFTSCISLIPQIYRSYKTKSVNDLSILMLWNFCISSISWVVYGLYIEAMSVLLTNVFMSITAVFLLVLKYKYQQQSSESPPL
jgi:MtN3 and saliva related transmembrane protein